MTAGQCTAIKRAVCERRNILVVGGTGTGKTTLTNAILAYMADVATVHRLVINEDTSEIQCFAENAVILRATDTVTMLRLLKTTMRLRPDRIIVGEVRGGEALALLKAWNTGHPGGVCAAFANTHANAARAGLTRIEQLIQEASSSPMRELIAEAVDLIVSIAKADNEPGRLVQEVVSVNGIVDGAYQLSNAECTPMQPVRETDDLGASDSNRTDAVGTDVPKKPMQWVHIPKYLPKKLPEVAWEARLFSILGAKRPILRKFGAV